MKNPVRTIRRLAIVIWPVVSLCGVASTRGAETTSTVQQAQLQADFRQRVAEAVVSARVLDIAAAEATLTRLNTVVSDSAQARIELASRLIHLAEKLALEGRADAVSALSSRALVHLAAVDASSANAKLRSSGRVIAGAIYEKYRGDISAALSSYEGALELNPESRQASENVRRLRATLARLQGGTTQ